MNPFIPGLYEKDEQLALDAFKKAYTGITSVVEYEPTKYGMHYDVWARNKRGEVEHIELKLRNPKAETRDDCFIEVEKWMNMLRDFRERPEHPKPIYINFFGDETNAYVWDLSKIQSAVLHPNLNIRGEICDRIGLDWKDAWHFVKQTDGTYKTINKGK